MIFAETDSIVSFLPTQFRGLKCPNLARVSATAGVSPTRQNALAAWDYNSKILAMSVTAAIFLSLLLCALPLWISLWIAGFLTGLARRGARTRGKNKAARSRAAEGCGVKKQEGAGTYKTQRLVLCPGYPPTHHPLFHCNRMPKGGWTKWGENPLFKAGTRVNFGIGMVSKMRRLIRHKATLAFFNKSEWTTDVNRGQEFASIDAAHQSKRQFHLENVEMYFAFKISRPEANYDFSATL